MNKAEAIDQIARSADTTKTTALQILNALEASIKTHIDAGKRIQLNGLCSFTRSNPTHRAQPAYRSTIDLYRLPPDYWRTPVQRK